MEYLGFVESFKNLPLNHQNLQYNTKLSDGRKYILLENRLRPRDTIVERSK